MNLDAIRVWRDTGGESLTLALLALLEAGQCLFEYDEVNSALGISFLTVAGDAPLAYWSTAGRDARLAESARLFGVYLRPLHPADTARGLQHSLEYADHFRDSYVPLIQRSLAAGQAVLAWAGWPGDAATQWGVIITESDGPMGVAGRTVVAGDRVDLVSPAFQCYVVEQVTGASPSAVELVGHTVQVAAQLMSSNNRIGAWTTGPETYDLWRRVLLQPDAVDPIDDHVRLAESIAANRKCAGRFMSRHQSVVAPAGRSVELVIRHARMAGEQAADLAGLLASGGLTDEIRKKAAEKIRQIQTDDEAIADNITALAGRITAMS